MAGVEMPPAGTGLLIFFHFSKANAFNLAGVPVVAFTANILPDGGVVFQNATAAENTTGSAAEAECEDRYYAATGPKWRAGDMPVNWRIDKQSFPGYLNADTTMNKLKGAYAAWQKPTTGCNNPNANSFRFSYAGLTTKDPKYDGVNAVDFGSLGSNALAMTYVWYVDSRIYESDMRLNKPDYDWSNDPKARKYQVIEVATHETGHTAGLKDLKDPHGRLTMFGLIGKGELKKKTLGRGDLRGAAAVGP